MRQIILLFVLVVAMCIAKIAMNKKNLKDASKRAPLDSSARPSENINVFAEPKKQPHIEQKPIKQEVRPTIKPTIRDHLHGTTSQTSKQNCQKPHDGTYKTNFEIKTSDEEKKITLSSEDLKKIVIMGDAVANPAFKRKRK